MIFSACEGMPLEVLIPTSREVYPIIPTILVMNMFPAGSRVFFYDSTGQLVRGVVESTSRMADGTQMVVIRRDNGVIMTFPSASVSKG
ncbi:hypothetical protein IW261DRAFT_1520578 [Armillaria novae-zelandiae]|uniref:Uncharacterized protein n=1 Tax=Armillaria novae-zelandiae TaxID=153914 RepID=A0AA39T5X8_9AGAR|nr:hypothetical protein IW261DRAFT_1520578 [Armillaria novae-zelandiae]